MTVDGADFPIWEPRPYCKVGNAIWYSPKFKGAGLRYELGVCIQTGNIVWINGPYPCGWGPDIKIFNQMLRHLLLPFEKIMADQNYRFGLKCYTRCDVKKYLDRENNVKTEKYMAISRALARHETINGRMKEFSILRKVYRCDRANHFFVFSAIAALTQIEMIKERPVFEATEYTDLITP